MLKIDRVKIDEKSAAIDFAISQLKKEFVGIDEQIESVMNNFRVWYLYPELQTRPFVVNIFGMTGCGKSSLIKRIVELLGVEKDLAYFNFSSITEKSSWEIERDIEKAMGTGSKRKVIVYDEFQTANTLNKSGEEKDNRNALKPFWEILDTGILEKRIWISEYEYMSRVAMWLEKINNMHHVNISNGKWHNMSECLSLINGCVCEKISWLFNNCSPSNDYNDDGCLKASDSEIRDETVGESDRRRFFLTSIVIDEIVGCYRKCVDDNCDETDILRMMSGMDCRGIIDFIYSIIEKASMGYKIDFRESIVFVIANIDEAYTMAYDMNPDMSPDQFHVISKKISVVDIKQALQKRFRNEQIARLGNIHVIYPSFSSKSFRKIIDLNLSEYADDIRKNIGIGISFDKSIKKVIYSESVFPTQGTRPIFSTIHEIVKTKIPVVVRGICSSGKDREAESVRCSFKNKKTVIDVLDSCGNVIDTYKFTDKLRLGELRKSVGDEVQANTAVHESGHFAVYAYLYGKIPEKIVSRSTDKSCGGFVMDSSEKKDEVCSYEMLLNKIRVSLGGYVAEGLVFGEDKRSCGASSDLEKATSIASKIVREYGLAGYPYVTTHLRINSNNGTLINEDDQKYINDEIKNILFECEENVRDILKYPNIMNMLRKSSKYLLNNSEMPKSVMTELLNEARNEGFINECSETFYRDSIDRM